MMESTELFSCLNLALQDSGRVEKTNFNMFLKKYDTPYTIF